MFTDPLFVALAIPAVIFAGVSKGGFGSGAAFAATPLLALVVEPGMALGVMLPLLMLVDAVTLRPYWRQWSWPDAKLLIVGGVPGVVLGIVLWQVAPADVFRVLIGVIALGFVAWQLFGRRMLVASAAREMPASVGLATGVISGFTSFVSHAGGPPVAVYLLGRGLSKTTYQATTVLVFWAVNLVKAVPYAAIGIFTAETITATLWLAPFALLGAWIGVKAHRLVPERLFFALTYVMLVGAGVKLIYDAAT
ncbi:sulfite exporter TauE/SafE family protein [Ovoidimarina sediminis]|uniref:sulfite exporter TauE/SafE family protein n=1 Tax=Ovoidimarina sediminis TaxID=3079856 RepID=UPI002912FF41|nr:sulfite exporter TauE/SafE family protein [Rhodophyticola sp. MJ-SS7]MDU8944601.1 sulfite exporter TauE/SafE family protein [Rhodophyticola sp. MJ-SS7]